MTRKKKKTAVKKSVKKAVKKISKKKTRKITKKAVKKTASAPATAQRLLGRFEPKPYRVENLKGAADALIVCDHASNAVPRALGTLGLSRRDLKKHIAWDPGTADIGRAVSRAVDATVVYANYSRLVVDLNRGADNGECIRPVSDHVRIPANEKLSKQERAQRLDEIFHPYHAQIDAQLDRLSARGKGKKRTPVLISIHSFTPKMDGIKRPWEIGVLWNREEKIARQLIANLRAQNKGLTIGENEPYSLKAANVTKSTISTHAEARGLPYIILEFRQDLVGTKQGARKWADIFLQSLRPILADENTYKKRRA